MLMINYIGCFFVYENTICIIFDKHTRWLFWINLIADFIVNKLKN